MKKIIAILLATLCVMSLAACGSKPAEAPASTATQAPAAPAVTEAPAEQKTEGYTSSQGTVDGYDPNQQTDFERSTSEDVRVFQLGTVDKTLFETPILVTSFGQSADASMMEVMMKKAGVKDYVFNAQADETMVKNFKTIIIVCGASSKGLGAAGVSEADETARAEKIMAAIEESKPAIIMCHLGGSIRRGAMSDKFTDMVLNLAQYMVVVEDANFDGKFTNAANEKNIPLTFLYAIADGVKVFSELFAQ